MRSYYINLDDASERRSALEASFARHAPAGLALTRVPAIDARHGAAPAMPGTIRSAEIACFLSHRKALEVALASEGDALILEDDALLGPSTFPQLSRAKAMQDDTVDIVFIGSAICDFSTLSLLLLLRRTMLQRGETTGIDAAGVFFAGADAYVVKQRAKPKLLGLIHGLRVLDQPYDLQLRSWINQQQIKAVIVFPYLSSLSPQADISQNANTNTAVLAWNAMRRIMAYDAAHYPADALDFLSHVDPALYEAETDRFLQVARVLLSPRLPRN